MTFDPTTHDNLVIYIPNVADEPTQYYIGNASDGGNADEAADLVGTINQGIGGAPVFAAPTIAPSTERRIPLAADGYGNLGLQGTTGRLLRDNSVSYANTFHQNRAMWFIAVFKPDTSITVGRGLLDSTNLANPDGSAQGVRLGTASFANTTSVGGIYRKTSGAVGHALIKNATTTPIVNIYAEDDLAELTPSLHVMIGHITPTGLCELRVDQGRKSYALVDGAAGTGNAAFSMSLMNRASADGNHFPGILLSLGVYSAYPGDDALDEWLERWPLGSIAGSSEIRVGEHHLNFSKDQAGMPYCHWFKGKRISGVNRSSQNEGGHSTVLNDGVGTDYLGGSTGNSGGPHRNETLNSTTITVDGVSPGAYASGQLYEGNSVIRVVRNTTIGISFEMIETTTLTSSTHRVNTVLNRQNDARTINPLYVRLSRDTTFEDFLAFDADGEIVHDSSVTASDFTCDAGVIAVAQWSPTGVMALSVVTKGQALDFTTLILYSASEARRIYHRFNDIPTGTESVEFETYSKFYETTAEAWEALAESELLRILNPPTGPSSMGNTLGISF